MNGAESLLRSLLANGVDVCFMNPGTSEMQFVSALDRVPGMRGVLCLFEGRVFGGGGRVCPDAGKPAATLLHLGTGPGERAVQFPQRAEGAVACGEHRGASTPRSTCGYDAPLTADIEAFARRFRVGSGRRRAPRNGAKRRRTRCAAASGPPGQVASLIVPADFSWSEAENRGGSVFPGFDAATGKHVACPRVRATPRARCAPASRSDCCSAAARCSRPRTSRGGQAARRDRSASVRRPVCGQDGVRRRAVPAVERMPYFPEAAQAMLAGLSG